MLVCGLLATGGCRPTIIGPTQPSGYRLTLPETSQTLRLQPLTLTVHVTDASERPVDDVPVHFRVLPRWATVAEISPPTVTTRQGQASATFRARTAGDIVIEVTVEDLTQASTYRRAGRYSTVLGWDRCACSVDPSCLQ